MLVWDQYQSFHSDKEPIDSQEEEIDISSELLDIDNHPTIVEINTDSHNLKKEKQLQEKVTFPWTSEQIRFAIEAIRQKENVKELEDVVFYNEKEYYNLINH